MTVYGPSRARAASWVLACPGGGQKCHRSGASAARPNPLEFHGEFYDVRVRVGRADPRAEVEVEEHLGHAPLVEPVEIVADLVGRPGEWRFRWCRLALIQPSAIRPARRNAGSAAPPGNTGGCGHCTGFGSTCARGGPGRPARRGRHRRAAARRVPPPAPDPGRVPPPSPRRGPSQSRRRCQPAVHLAALPDDEESPHSEPLRAPALAAARHRAPQGIPAGHGPVPATVDQPGLPH
jgi:hypothetical protein